VDAGFGNSDAGFGNSDAGFGGETVEVKVTETVDAGFGNSDAGFGGETVEVKVTKIEVEEPIEDVKELFEGFSSNAKE